MNNRIFKLLSQFNAMSPQFTIFQVKKVINTVCILIDVNPKDYKWDYNHLRRQSMSWMIGEILFVIKH